MYMYISIFLFIINQVTQTHVPVPNTGYFTVPQTNALVTIVPHVPSIARPAQLMQHIGIPMNQDGG